MTKTGRSTAYDMMTLVLAIENELRRHRTVATQARARIVQAARTLHTSRRRIVSLQRRLGIAKKRYKIAKSNERRAERLARSDARKTKV